VTLKDFGQRPIGGASILVDYKKCFHTSQTGPLFGGFYRYSSRYRYEFDRYERKIFETFISTETTFSRDLGPFSSISARARSAFLLFDKKKAAADYIAPPQHIMAALWCLNCARA
jgi:hypothetical protein